MKLRVSLTLQSRPVARPRPGTVFQPSGRTWASHAAGLAHEALESGLDETLRELVEHPAGIDPELVDDFLNSL